MWRIRLFVCLLVCGAAGVAAEDFEFDLEDTFELAAAVAPAGEFTCQPELGFLREGGVYNNPDELITESPLDCCRVCFDDPRCQTWSRNRLSGACALMDTVAPLVPNEMYDSGLLTTVDAVTTVRQQECEIVRGVSYPEGDVLEMRRVRNAKKCCARCRVNLDCFSWYFQKGSRKCVLNRDIPQVERRRAYRGNALF